MPSSVDPLWYIPEPPEGWNWLEGGEPDWRYAWGAAVRASDGLRANMSVWACIDVATAAEKVSDVVGDLLVSPDIVISDEGFLGDESYELCFTPGDSTWFIVWRHGTVAGHCFAETKGAAHQWANLMDGLITATPTPSYKTVLVALSAIGVGLVLLKVT